RLDLQLALEVAVGDGGDDLGDAAHLAGQVTCHVVDAVGQVLPGAGDAAHLGLPAQLPLGAYLEGHACHLGRERPQLIHHRVGGVLQFENLALDVHGDLLGQVTVGHGGGDLGDVAHLTGQVPGHRVDVIRQVLPHSGDPLHQRLPTEFSFR